jgi:cell division septation protein DedD
MDPLGQSIIVRPAAGGDSAWVVGVGDERVQGTIETAWRNDLPAYAPGSAIATVRGSDVTMVNTVNLHDMQTIKDGAADFWYFVSWNGFRPRAADLDRPVSFGSSDTTVKADSGAGGLDSTSAGAPNPPIRDTAATVIVPPPALTAPRQGGYIVSFAAVLTSQKANELAAGITIGGAHPRVSPTQSGATTIYRVVMGPYATREEADRVGKDSQIQYWVYEGSQ